MRKNPWFCLVLLLCVGRLPAEEGKVVLETWDAAYLEGVKSGYVHTVTRETGEKDRKLLRTTKELNLTIKRFRDTVQMRMETGTEEGADGKVTSVYMRQLLSKDQELVLTGTVEENQLNIVADEVRGRETRRQMEKKVPWNDQVIGMYQQERIFQERKVKPDDQFAYLSYEPMLAVVVTTRVKVTGYEEVEVQGSKKRLLCVQAAPDKIKVKETSVDMPSLTVWLDKDYAAVRSQVEIPGLGKLLLFRTTRAQALTPSEAHARIRDIGFSQLIALNRRIVQPYETRTVLYRITLKGDDDPTSAFASDERQKIQNAKGDTFEVLVRSERVLQPVDKPEKVKEEYLKSCYFINSNDAKVKEHAAAAVGRETDPWKKALRIERWVHQRMQVNKNFTEAFATADHVARTFEGDCTEHAVLAAGMCRAAGVPARTACGLLYIDGGAGPALGFHMWTEVHVNGHWVPIDATLGTGFVGATHLKISDHSWHDTQSLTPLLPVFRVIGKLTIEVVRVNEEK